MVSLRDALRGRLSAKELDFLRASFDVVGDIAIIEVPLELQKRGVLIAETLLKLHKNVRVVACKVGGHVGRYRRQRLRVLAGEKRFVTLHRESGCVFRLDVEKCYFSPRLVSERLRVASLVKPGERVLVACSGVAPFPIIIAKKSGAKSVVGVELNPVAHRFAEENVVLNKVGDRVEVVRGDVRKLSGFGRFDRILLPAPKEGSALLVPLLKFAKRGTFLHVYDFEKEGCFSDAEDRVREACRSVNRSCRVLRTVKAGQHAVRVFRVCVDAVVTR